MFSVFVFLFLVMILVGVIEVEKQTSKLPQGTRLAKESEDELHTYLRERGYFPENPLSQREGEGMLKQV